MSVFMVREPSETPNISNVDDIIGLRYTYGNQNGYVLNKGNEISSTVNGSTITINSGRLVLNGVECDIDANGVAITVDNVATKRYYTIYLQVNLNTNTASILSSYATGDYPTISAGDDLTANPSGTARMELYHFTAQSGTISNVTKVVSSIKYTKNIKVLNSEVADYAVKDGNNYQPLNIVNNELMCGSSKVVYTKESVWTGSLYVSGTKTLELSSNIVNNLNIGDELVFVFKNLSNGDIIGIEGWDGKEISLPIVNQPLASSSSTSNRNSSISVLDITCSNSRVQASIIMVSLSGTTIKVQISVESHNHSSVSGGGALSDGTLTNIYVVRRKIN